MRKTFLTFCAAALALLAVSSCGKIWDEFDAVHGEIDDLKAKIEALEKKLNDEVATLNDRLGGVQAAFAQADAELKAALETKLAALDTKLSGEISSLRSELDALDGAIDGKLSAAEEEIVKAITDLTTSLNTKYEELKGVDAKVAAALVELGVTKVVKNSDGNAVITFADGTSIEVAADANVNNEGLVTVVDGKWAVIGADGETTVLDAEVHPDTKLTFKVDLDTKELLYSIDGKNYEKTGAYVSDEQFSIVSGVVEGDDYVTITIGGVEYNLPKVSTNTFDIVSGKVFFQSYETKSVPVAMKGVVSSMVANVPAGWSVKLTNGGLSVTAPGASMDDWGDLVPENPGDEVAGVVEIWVVTEDGKTFVGKLGVTLASQSDYAVITITEKSKVRFDVGPMFADGNFYYGACKIEDYDPEALNTAIGGIMDYENMPKGVNRFFDMTYGDEPWIDTTLEEILGSEVELGSTYVVWGYCYETGFDPMTWTRTVISTANDFIAAYVTPTSVEFTSSASWNKADLTVKVAGAEKYLGLVMDAETYSMYAPMLQPESLAEMGMTLEHALTEMMSLHAYYTEDFEGDLSTFGLEEEYMDYAEPLVAGTEYTVIVLPIEPYRDPATYTFNDLSVHTVKTADLTYGGQGVVTFGEPSVSYTDFNVDINSTGAMTVYNCWTTEEYEAIEAEMPAGETMGDYLMLNYGQLNMFDVPSTTAYFGNYPSLQPGTSYTVAAIAIDADGKCSDVVTIVVETLAIPYDTTGSVVATIESVVFDPENAKNVTVTYNVAGATKLAVYGNSSGAVCYYSASASIVSSWEMKLVTQPENYQLSKHDVVDGKVTVTYKNYSTSNKYVYFMPYNVDENGTLVSFAAAKTADLSTYVTAE